MGETMEISDLNVRRYIKEQTKNIAFKRNRKLFYISYNDQSNNVDFDSVYKNYYKLKMYGKELIDEQIGKINIIEFHNNKMDFKWPLFERNSSNSDLIHLITNKHVLKNEILGLDKLEQVEIDSFATFMYLCSDSLKNFCNNYFSTEHTGYEFDRLIRKYNGTINTAFDDNDLEKIVRIIQRIETLYCKLPGVKEILEYKDHVILPVLCFNDELSLYFHFFKLEIVYYSHILQDETKPKLCPVCNNYTSKCTCITLTDTEKKRINRACEKLRKELNSLISNNRELLEDSLYEESRELIDGSHSYKQLDRLKELIEIIHKQIKGN